MKKKTKYFLGILGLSVVAALTSVAVNLPSPDAIATSSITDTITVRVVSSDASVDITNPPKDAIYTEPNQKLNFNYANVDEIEVTLYFTDSNNLQHEFLLDKFNKLDYQPGEKELPLDLAKYGYGEYIIEAKGTGISAVGIGETSFKYVPMTADLEQKDDGSYWEHLVYNTEVVGSVKIEIFNEGDTNFTNPLWSKEVSKGEKDVKLPFGEDESMKESKKYIIRIIPYSYANPTKTPLYKPIYQEVETQSIIVPDTGAFLRNLNISRTDYLITGIIIFASFAVFAFVFTSKRRKAYRQNYTRRSNSVRKSSTRKSSIKKSSSRKK